MTTNRWAVGGSLRIRVALVAITVLTVVAASLVVGPTRAAWTDAEHATATVSAGHVAAPTNLTCTGSVLTGRVSFRWTAPVGGVTRTGYTWTMSGVISRNGTATADTVTITETVPLFTLGTATLTMRATGPGGWTSTTVSRSFLIVSGGIISCS